MGDGGVKGDMVGNVGVVVESRLDRQHGRRLGRVKQLQVVGQGDTKVGLGVGWYGDFCLLLTRV